MDEHEYTVTLTHHEASLVRRALMRERNRLHWCAWEAVDEESYADLLFRDSAVLDKVARTLRMAV